MCTDNGLRAQARTTSRDVMRIMGGVAFGVGLISLAVATAIGLDRNQIEPFRVIMSCSTIAIVLGGVVALNANLSRRLEQVERIIASSLDGEAGDNTVALIKGRRF